MPKDDLIYIGHMLEQANLALSIIQGKDRQAYDNDQVLRLALVRLIQVIGEAARLVSQPTRDIYPQIPWTVIVGMRHRVVHDYMNVDENILWDTVTLSLPPLVAELEKIIPASNP